jgi:copper(I)-binding protein
MTVANTGSSLSILVSASSPDFGEVSLHHTLESHGISTMRSIDSVLLRPGESVRFAEGGYHLMLMQPRRSLNAGDRVIVTLVFRSGPPIDVPFTVRTSDSP